MTNDFRPTKNGRNYYVGIDRAAPSGDYTVETMYRKPSKFQLFLRKHGISRATWDYKVIGARTIRKEQPDAKPITDQTAQH